jgi:hypothetical protein
VKDGLVKKTAEDKVVELMCAFLELEEESEKVVQAVVRENGIKEFFESVDRLNVHEQEKERINALKQVIEAKEEEIEMMEGVDDNGN